MSHTTSYQKLEILSAIIFWGAVWGIITATFGYIIHRISIPYHWLILFLICMPCLAVAYRQTGLKMSPVYIAVIASLIRCIQLAFMGNAHDVLTSIMWILIEGMAMTAFITIAQLKPLPKGEAYIFKPIWTTVTLTISLMLTIAI